MSEKKLDIGTLSDQKLALAERVRELERINVALLDKANTLCQTLWDRYGSNMPAELVIPVTQLDRLIAGSEGAE